jgi:Zn-dependent peptidase ImmA (M78 family)/transcriptional regulator with XRE-family HTH domain
LGFNDRQTLSGIEQGIRNVKPEELLRAATFFEVSPNFFTDPLELAGEAQFSWRKSIDNGDGLDVFEAKAERWIATFRHLNQLRGEIVNSSLMRLGLNRRSSFLEAMEEGDAIAQALELGNVPAVSLPSVLEEKLNTLVLFVDPEPGISGAACQLGPLNTILINRNESLGRRSFDLGHEFFHLLTWADMPPRHCEGLHDGTKQQQRVETLADNFSAGLLMPRRCILKLIELFPIPENEDGIAVWIRKNAPKLGVSGQALKWQLVNLGILRNAIANQIDDSDIRIGVSDDAVLPPRFSKKFVDTLGWGIEMGHLSTRKAAKILDTTLDDLAVLFAEHGLETPFDL